MLIDSSNLKPKWAECAIVLGGGIRKNNQPDSDTKDRLKKLLSLFNDGYIPRILVTGGKVQKDLSISEASIMKDYLIKHGVAANKILIETDSKDTIGNALFSKVLVQKRNWNKIILITSDYHISRSLRIFDHIFGNDFEFIGVESNGNTFPFFESIRETAASLYDMYYLFYIPKGINVKNKKNIREILNKHFKYK